MLKGKAAIVTGSTSGIGLGIATRACGRRLRGDAERLWRSGSNRSITCKARE